MSLLGNVESKEVSGAAPVVDEVTHTAATLAAVELGLGSILHGLRIPFSGFALSLNQGFFLSRSTFASAHDPKAKALPATVSTLVALLKSFSPAGKRLTPMLAIEAQGLLFNLGTLVLGRNLVGACVGSVLLGLWGFFQAFAIYYVVFGQRFLNIGAEIVKDLGKFMPVSSAGVVWAAAGLVALKCFLSILVALLANRISPELARKYEEKLLKSGSFAQKKWTAMLERGSKTNDSAASWVSAQQAARGALSDLLNPFYLVSLAIGLAFLVFVESDAVGAIWMLARFVSAGFVVFFLLRALPVEHFIQKLERSSHPRLSHFGRRLRGTLVTLMGMGS